MAAVAGCDDAGGTPGDAAGSPNLAGGHRVSPDLADPAAAQWDGGDGKAHDELASHIEEGRQFYLATCAACHGTVGRGLPHQGPDLRGGGFIGRSSDDEVLAFLAAGRSVGDPRNTTGLPMPPRGGNPSLSDRHLGQIVKYLRTVIQAKQSRPESTRGAESSEARSWVSSPIGVD